MTRQKANMPIDEKEKHDRISVLSTQISVLEDQEKQLNSSIETKKKAIEQYKENQQILDGIMQQIIDKTSFRDSLTTEIDSLVENRTSLLRELEQLNPTVEEKKKYVSNIETLKKNIVILQGDMEKYKNDHSVSKKSREKEIEDLKQKIIDIHKNIGEVISKI